MTRARPVVLAVLLLTLVLAGCGRARDVVRAEPEPGPTTGGSSQTTPPAPSPTPTGAPTSPPTVDLPDIVGAIASFTTPTGNIGCYIGSQGARCDIRERSFEPPAEPESCGLAWGNSLEVGADGAGFACVGDTVMGSDTILKYGNSTLVGDYGCTSATTGVTCVNRSTGHGFSLSRASARTF
ncbi:DUF6636 domain-containing protein [Solicola sp. PLA-1-18]|uniref:DUF6636 domain-containing protein n=1 Tax=Solicola sp. PLA-1-18 TaxID=3380532 RepID=UPI003B7F8C4D